MRRRKSRNSAAIAALMWALSTGMALGATSYSAPQLYNMGNAFARNGKPGLAVLEYERARLLAPSDPDLQANLRYVLETAAVPAVTGNAFNHYAGWLRSSRWFWLGCIGIALTGTSEVARRIYPRHRSVLRAISATGVVSVVLALCAAATLWPVMSEAVVIAPTTTQRVAPANMAEPLRTLREAQIVTVEAQRQGFALVQTSAGLTGWVLRSDLAPVVPRGSWPVGRQDVGSTTVNAAPRPASLSTDTSP